VAHRGHGFNFEDRLYFFRLGGRLDDDEHGDCCLLCR
jgi:hypothetical protein